MDYKKRKAAAAKRQAEDADKLDLEGITVPGILSTLPVELWKPIASYLPPSDRAALAMSSRYFMTCLGPTALKDLNIPDNRNEKLKFLFHSLKGQLPDHYLCDRCVIYHDDAVAYKDYQGPEGREPFMLYPGLTYSFSELHDAMETNRDFLNLDPDDRIQCQHWRARNCKSHGSQRSQVLADGREIH